MNPTIQPGTHPDAESLTAFAERSLSGAEREQILAHMIVCGRCREVVFLAQLAMDAEAPASLPAPDSARDVKHGWFAGWRWAWIPVAALAGFVGIAVVQHMRHVAPPQEMARNAQRAEVINDALAARTPNPAPKQQAPKRNQLPASSAVRQGYAIRDDKTAGAAAEKKETKQKDEREESAYQMGVIAGAAGGTIHGALVPRAKSNSMGGPMAQNQVQQQNYLDQQNTSLQAQTANAISNKPIAPAPSPPAARPGAASETVEVQSAQQAAVASAPPAEAPQITTVAVSGRNVEVAKEEAGQLKTGKVNLPGGHEPLSVAMAARREIAIDTAGALFLSKDAGKHWQPVKTQWTGRAVLVRARQADTSSAALSIERAPQFELVNDNLETWVSADGKTWTKQALPEK